MINLYYTQVEYSNVITDKFNATHRKLWLIAKSLAYNRTKLSRKLLKFIYKEKMLLLIDYTLLHYLSIIYERDSLKFIHLLNFEKR